MPAVTTATRQPAADKMSAVVVVSCAADSIVHAETAISSAIAGALPRLLAAS